MGAVDGRPVGGPIKFGSGILISPTVFLTVAHGTAHFDASGLTRARITFDPDASSASTWYQGTVHTNPAWDPSAKGQRGDRGARVIIFDRPVAGWLRLRSTSGADICSGDSGSASVPRGTNLVLGITSVQWSLSGGECESGPWEQRVDTPAARAFLSQYVELP